jgi:hypothetical protein
MWQNIEDYINSFRKKGTRNIPPTNCMKQAQPDAKNQTKTKLQNQKTM